MIEGAEVVNFGAFLLYNIGAFLNHSIRSAIMPFCPSCKYEYVPGITKCPDCRVDLVDELAAAPPPQPQQQSEWADLVTVANFRFDVEAQAAKLRLESYDIRAVLSNEIISQVDAPIAFMTGGIHLMVNREDAQRALEALAGEG